MLLLYSPGIFLLKTNIIENMGNIWSLIQFCPLNLPRHVSLATKLAKDIVTKFTRIIQIVEFNSLEIDCEKMGMNI